MRGVVASFALALLVTHASQASANVVDFVVRDDAVSAPLDGLAGNARRGELIVRDRRVGNCLICHSVPIDDEAFPGDIGPPLAGVGKRLQPGQLRLRLIDSSRLNPATLMPPYYRIDRLTDVAPEYAGTPALDAQQIEDVVAYLSTLTDPSQ